MNLSMCLKENPGDIYCLIQKCECYSCCTEVVEQRGGVTQDSTNGGKIHSQVPKVCWCMSSMSVYTDNICYYIFFIFPETPRSDPYADGLVSSPLNGTPDE